MEIPHEIKNYKISLILSPKNHLQKSILELFYRVKGEEEEKKKKKSFLYLNPRDLRIPFSLQDILMSLG